MRISEGGYVFFQRRHTSPRSGSQIHTTRKRRPVDVVIQTIDHLQFKLIDGSACVSEEIVRQVQFHGANKLYEIRLHDLPSERIRLRSSSGHIGTFRNFCTLLDLNENEIVALVIAPTGGM